jgi:dolichol-phosphate mannosyltransferase
MKLSIVIPVFNEKNTIIQLIEMVESVDFENVEKEIIIVDDFSNDGTREALKNYENRHKVLYHEKNHGKGRALRTGFALATGDWIVVQDADLEYEPKDLKRLLEKIMEEGVSVVYGSRLLSRNVFKRKYSGYLFALGGILVTAVTNLLYGTRITDEPTCYKMFRRDLLPELDLQCERFEFCPELTAKLAKKGLKIHEVPINYYPRHKNEGKKIKLKDGIEAITTLLKWRFKK